jgi:hypothetical protein
LAAFGSYFLQRSKSPAPKIKPVLSNVEVQRTKTKLQTGTKNTSIPWVVLFGTLDFVIWDL